MNNTPANERLLVGKTGLGALLCAPSFVLIGALCPALFPGTAHAQAIRIDPDEVYSSEGDALAEDADEDEEDDDEKPQDRAPVQLQELAIEASAVEPAQPDALSVKAGREKVDKKQLEARQVRRLSDALRWTASAASVDTSTGASAMIVDGLPAAQVQVVQDGMPVSRPVGGPDGPSVDLDSIQVSTTAVESITVQRGLGAPGSGPASGVVVEMTPAKQPMGWAAAAKASATLLPDQNLYPDENAADASFPTQQSLAAEVGYGAERASIRLNGSFLRRAGVDVNADGATDSADQDQLQFGVHSEWRPDASARNALSLALNFEQFATEGVFGPTSVMRDLINTDRAAARLKGKWQLAPGTTLSHATQFDIYQHRFSKRVLSSDIERLKADTGQLRLTQDVLVERLFGRHLLGIEAYGAAERVSRDGETGLLPNADRFDGGLGLSDGWMPSQTLEVSGRVWAGLHTEFDPSLMADLSSQWRVAEPLVLRASASRTRRLPTAEELYLFFDHSEIGYQVIGNPELKPEGLWSARAGMVFDFSKISEHLLQLSLGGFYHRLNDLITTAADEDAPGRVAQFRYANVARAQTAGLNAGVDARDVLWGVDARANYSWLPLAEDMQSGQRLALRTRHQLMLEVSRDWLEERVETAAHLRARSALATPSNQPEAPAFTMLGARVSYKPIPSLRIGLNADNLLNQTNATWGPKNGFSVMAHIAYHYESPQDEKTPQDAPQ